VVNIFVVKNAKRFGGIQYLLKNGVLTGKMVFEFIEKYSKERM